MSNAGQHSDKFRLLADVGGTNTRVALAQGAQVLPKTVRKFANADHPGLGPILSNYLAAEGNLVCEGACIAVAGPVRDGVGELTNRNWTIDRAGVSLATGAQHVAILNDLQAQGHALTSLDDEHLDVVVPIAASGSAKAVKLTIGIGTGFNAAPVFYTEAGVLVPPSEAGHANLPIRNADELSLCQFVETAHGFPAVEDVLSGRGLERVYHWCGHEVGTPEEKSSADIMAALASGTDPKAERAVAMFIKIMGTVAGNLSLIQLPFGGVYLIGGMARAMAPHFTRFGFVDAFRDKGRFAGFMGNFGVSVVTDDFAALKGCASHLEAVIAAN